MRTTGARRADAWTVATIVPSGADWIQYQTVFSIRPQRETCGSRRSTVASAVVPWTIAGKVGRTRASSRLSFGGGAAAAGAARMSAAKMVAISFMSASLRVRDYAALTRGSHGLSHGRGSGRQWGS